jgi:hypothetical protein
LRGFGVQAAPPEGLGLSLAGTYAAWILIMAALYPACRWFASVKRRRRRRAVRARRRRASELRESYLSDVPRIHDEAAEQVG